MKRRDLVSELEKNDCVLLRNGTKHDIYHNPQTGKTEPVPIHREINERLAQKILKNLTEK